MSERPPLPATDWKLWAERLIDFLQRTKSQLTFKTGTKPATQNGVILWDTSGYPVVSKDGEYRQIVLADGYASYSRSTDQVAAAANTAYPITFDTTVFENGLTLGADNYTITFEEEGIYMLSFSVQLLSSSSGAKNAWFWPRINGTDSAGSTIKVTLSANSQTLVMSRSAIFPMSAGDTLAAYWAVDDVDLHLDALASTAFAPSAPSVILGITRLRQ